MWNPFTALMRAEDRMFAAARQRRPGRRQRPILTMIAGSAILLTAGVIILLLAGFKSAKTPLFVAAGWSFWAVYLSIVRLTVHSRRRS